MGGSDTELEGEGAIEVERRDGGVAQVEDAVVGAGQGVAEVADGGGLADAGVAGEDGEAAVVEELGEWPAQSLRLSASGEAAALEAMHARATRPHRIRAR